MSSRTGPFVERSPGGRDVAGLTWNDGQFLDLPMYSAPNDPLSSVRNSSPQVTGRPFIWLDRIWHGTWKLADG